MTRFNALFHWAVPPGREIETGREVGRHYIMTHAYWREGGPEFHNVNIMGVAHGMDKALLLANTRTPSTGICSRAAFRSAIRMCSGRAKSGSSEIAPAAYREWLRLVGKY